MAEYYITDSVGYRHSLFITEKSYDVKTNTSVVEYSFQLKSGNNNGFAQYGIAWEVYINGVKVASHAKKSGEYTCRKGGNVLTFVTGTTTIEHDIYGSKSIECYARAFDIDQSVNYTPDNTIKPTGTFELSDINRGLVYIDNGTKLEPYMCYIDNGTSWDYYRPYIDNGTSFDEYN